MKFKETKKFIITNRFKILFLVIFLLHLFLRFYQISERNPFGWDQVDNAWTAKRIIVEGEYPLVGMVAKGNTGFHIGPAYYYLISGVYFLTGLNPIASGIFAGLTSIFSFGVLYIVSKKIFSLNTALIAVFIYTVAQGSILADRVQWPVNFIPPISYLIFFFIYKVITGSSKSIIWLALTVGFAFNIHFTAVFFPIIIFLILPFVPRTRETLKHILISIPAFFIWLLPNLIHEIQKNWDQSANLTGYIGNSYHGFHLRRVMQLLADGFIQFEPFLPKVVKFLKYILVPLGAFLVFLNTKKQEKKEALLLGYLMMLYFIVPWFVFATYNGEISDYYFFINRFVAIGVLSYVVSMFFKQKNILVRYVVVLALILYGYYNIESYFKKEEIGIVEKKQNVLEKINRGEKIEFKEGAADYYLYWYYYEKKGIGK